MRFPPDYQKQRHAFMLACREEIERNGAMRDHEVLSRVKLKAERRGLRCEVDPAGKNCLNKQIRYAEKLRVPIICVVGEQEASSGKLSVRARGRGDLGKIDVDVLLDMLGGVEDVDQLDAEAFEKHVAPDASARPLPTLLRLDADFCLELARELLRSEL